MTTAMGPPPPRITVSVTAPSPPADSDTKSPDDPSTSSAMKPPMGPPAPQNPNPSPPQQDEPQSAPPDHEEDAIGIPKPEHSSRPTSQGVAVPYTIPPWSGRPCHQFSLEVLKDGLIIDQFDVHEKGAYMFGRVDLCDFVLDHPTISRFHAVLQFRESGEAYLYDLGSTHGSFINKNQVKKKVYVDLHVGDVVRFGLSSRLYIFQGPSELMLPEKDLKTIREAKFREAIEDREASLRRARAEASLADGISWGMGEDAIEEVEDDGEEITWQTYKGQLTEKQEKTREKIIKRTEKIANMKKEIDHIRAKDIAQGGLTQGQQTQIARNEQRMSQLAEELENLEETLNESIQESLGARVGRITRGKKGVTEDDEEEVISDDDEFYDRTKKKSSTKKSGENQTVETADSLLDKRDTILEEMESKKELISIEKNKMSSETAAEAESGDALDAFMSGLSSKLVLDKTVELEKDLASLQSELDRILYLLKIADPTGETAKKRELKQKEPKPNKSAAPSVSTNKKQPPKELKKSSGSGKLANGSMHKDGSSNETKESGKAKDPEDDKIVANATEGPAAVYTVVKPQWLGAVHDLEPKKTERQADVSNVHESDDFVDYKDRKTVLGNVDNKQTNMDTGIESAAPGLIIRKQKPVEKTEGTDNKAQESSSSSTGVELVVEDAVALLLKHKRGYHEEDEDENQGITGHGKAKEKKKAKKTIGPEKPAFLNTNSDYEEWVPPKGQSGDGRTSLNDRYGY